MFQKDSTLAQSSRARTETGRGTRKTMIVTLARKLLTQLCHAFHRWLRGRRRRQHWHRCKVIAIVTVNT
jgi:hypothetical protein